MHTIKQSVEDDAVEALGEHHTRLRPLRSGSSGSERAATALIFSARGTNTRASRAISLVVLGFGLAACSGGASPDAGVDGLSPDITSADVLAGPDATDTAVDSGPPPRVSTSCGATLGIRTAPGARAFLGIPFAAPPVGANRFRPPQPATCGTPPRNASAFGGVCPQPAISGLPVPGAQSEDCLTLNVWTPDPAPTEPLPVLVFFYGGGFVVGGTSQAFYEGSRLAAQGAVVVTVNYRVGTLGWLAHPALTAEDAQHSSGDYGLFDQIAGLRWVRDEIAAFGGDPARVAIFGESAGGVSVCALVGSPLADGLYARAIVESGSCVAQGSLAPVAQITLATAEARGSQIASALGCTTGDVPTCLRGKSTQEILAAQPEFDAITWRVPFNVVVDGHALPRSTRDRLQDPSFAPAPMIVGTNRDEVTVFTLTTRMETEAEYAAAVNVVAGTHSGALLGAYPARDYRSPKDAFNAMMRDVLFTCPTRTLARLASARQPSVFLYQFSQENAGTQLFGLGATHTGELPYVFGNFSPPFRGPSADDRVVLAAMQGYWTRFASSGDPNGPGATAWPAFTTAGDTRLEIATPITTGTGLRRAQCDLIDTLP